ncbi:YT521-B-like domain-containing protein [Sordaria brevicollis]|uniref:YT521-B-like domain-containing protein n=1 Tax=Sordaria brevicollis TaxID=83679 RepID=A0AAE0UEX0_SORBR|nr:YT521-B-like domain-containing protein [Sordaria brevicollis]
MSNPPSMNKLALDAKTRELKQRLQSMRKDRSSGPASATSDGDLASATTRPVTATSTVASTPKPQQAQPRPPFIPHTIPPMPTETSISADDNDIFALIRSISSDVDPMPGILLTPGASTKMQNQSTPAPPLDQNLLSLPAFTEAVITAPSTPAEEGEIQSDADKPAKAKVPEPRQEHPKPQISQRTDKPPRSGSITIPNKKNFPQKGSGKPQAGTEKSLRTNDRPEPKSVQPKNGPAVASLTPEKALKRAQELNPDLREWLALTDYHNVEIRTKKLDRYRKLKALAAEKERIDAEHAAEKARLEAEQRKLLEEEGLDLGLVATPVTETAPVITNQLTEAPKAVVPKRERERSVDMAIHPPEKKYRPDENGARPMEIDNEYDDRYRERGRPEYPARRAPSWSPRRYRAPSPRRDHRPSRPSSRDRGYQLSRFSPRPRSRDRSFDGRIHDRYDNRNQRGDDGSFFFDNHRGDKAPRAQSPRRSRDPTRVEHFNTGEQGDTRFFVLKSFNNENLQKAMNDGVWVTQTSNEETFTKAFETCKNVIFFFSINKSKAFQGYALMTSLPSNSITKAPWMNNIHWQTSPPFRLRWLSKASVPFSLIGHLKNPLNENLPVLIAKDGQEVEEDCGRALLREMESYSQRESDNTASWWKKKKPHTNNNRNGNNNYHGSNKRTQEDHHHDRSSGR